MRTIVFLLLILAACYGGAMHQSYSLMVLFFAEILLMLCMWCLSRYLKKHLQIEFPRKGYTGVRKTEIPWEGCAANTGKLPAGRFRLRLYCGYVQEERRHVESFFGVSEDGSGKVCFGVYGQYCGIMEIRIDRFRVYDYLSLFYGTSRISEELKIVVFPSEKPLSIEFSAVEWQDEKGIWGNETAGEEYSHDEIRQLREYGTGDFYRHIHWKQSARTDKIWIKEYEKEGEARGCLLLEIHTGHWADLEIMDRFYRLLHALLLGLTGQMDLVNVCWYEGHGAELSQVDVGDDRQCKDLFFRLYQTDFAGMDFDMARTCLKAFEMRNNSCFRLDSSLCWYRGGQRIHQFSGDNLENEIADRVFVL